jgi:hypothetical protein
MPQHTPIPWEFFHRWDSEGNMTIAEVYRKTGDRLFGMELYDTIVRAPYWRTKEDHAQSLEDIRLCAAAPDLLAALERFANYCKQHSVPELQGIACDAFQAINKAKGIK